MMQPLIYSVSHKKGPMRKEKETRQTKDEKTESDICVTHAIQIVLIALGERGFKHLWAKTISQTLSPSIFQPATDHTLILHHKSLMCCVESKPQWTLYQLSKGDVGTM